MSVRTLVVVAAVLIAAFMLVTVVIALWQEDLGWGWWWAVPLGGAFIVAVIALRVGVQRLDGRDPGDDDHGNRPDPHSSSR